MPRALVTRPAGQAEDWVRSIIAALQFIGGVPRLLVPDQPRALMARPDRYEPTAHRLLAELGEHYGVAILPARPAHPGPAPCPAPPAAPAARRRPAGSRRAC